MSIPSETTAIAELGAETERRAPIPWLERLYDTVGRVVEFPAALLVVVEVVVLLVGVIWRYALHHPLVWSDELASILFVWLAMFGSSTSPSPRGHTCSARSWRCAAASTCG